MLQGKTYCQCLTLASQRIPGKRAGDQIYKLQRTGWRKIALRYLCSNWSVLPLTFKVHKVTARGQNGPICFDDKTGKSSSPLADHK